MTPQTSELLDRLVIEATSELLRACRVPVQATPGLAPIALPKTATVAGIVGFSGEQMRGTFLIASSFELLARSRPAALQTPKRVPENERDWVVIRDWAAELANQLLGRVKNRVYAMGITLHVSTPTALSGEALAVAAPSSPHARAHSFTSRGEEVWVCLDATLEPGVDLTQPRDDGAEAAREGDVLLF